MKIGFIGLGKMGQNMVVRLGEQGINVVGFNRTAEVTQTFAKDIARLGFTGTFLPVYDPASLVKALPPPRVIWLMVAAGRPVDGVIEQLVVAGVGNGDTIIDGGNSFYRDSVRRHEELKQRGIALIDCGTSGGLEGARNGACLMIGADEAVVRPLAWLWDRLSATWKRVGPPGSGHFVKMVHNSIEYGMNQALGEGFEMLSKGPYPIDLEAIANLWNQGSIIRGYLVELLGRAFAKDPSLTSFTGVIGGGETGAWGLATAKELGVATPVLQQAVEARRHSKTRQTFATKVVSALRHQYGGHAEGKNHESLSWRRS